MKFTKQEQSLIKLAAAHMAPQMHKKATLQDKLAEYGIGMKKQAGPLDYMKAINPLTGLPNTAAAGKAGAGYVLGKLLNQRAQKTNDKKIAPAAQSTNNSSLRQLGAAATGSSSSGKYPMIGMPMPADHKWDWEKDETAYPYTKERIMNSGLPPAYYDGKISYSEAAAIRQNNARLFDNALAEELKTSPFNQAAVDRARETQANELAKQISAPGTNQYNDARNMLIQAGRNNQSGFENSGRLPIFFSWDKLPENYKGPNRLNEDQMKTLRRLSPAMGDTTNPRRFSNLS